VPAHKKRRPRIIPVRRTCGCVERVRQPPRHIRAAAFSFLTTSPCKAHRARPRFVLGSDGWEPIVRRA